MTSTEAPSVENGVDVAALLAAREALTAAPEAAQFQWRARCASSLRALISSPALAQLPVDSSVLAGTARPIPGS